MDQGQQIAAELDVLRALCDGRVAAAQRADLCRSLGAYQFAEPEHQVVFESVRAFLERGQLTAEHLAVNLIKRGFTDTEMKRYFVAAPPGHEKALAQIAGLISLSKPPAI